MSAKPPELADARRFVERMLDQAAAVRASDVHLEPDADGYAVRRRVDGLLSTAERCDAAAGRSAVTRLMVMAHLLTYRLDIPQEGRISVPVPSAGRVLDLRLAVMPTTHGLRAVVRLPADLTQPRRLDELQLPRAALDGLKRFAATDAGMLLLTGPAGSGKTTTIYALLEYIADTSSGISIIALEDPVERDLAGVTQIQVNPFGELSYEKALRSILRQDPQVLMLGEIRDAATASIAVQAALSGHRLISTMHAGSPAQTIARLLEMDLEPYQITSALFAVVAQRLLRARTADGDYHGRLPIAEFAELDDALRQAVLSRSDAAAVRSILDQRPAYVTLRDAARDAVAQHLTDEPELHRVLGADAPGVDDEA